MRNILLFRKLAFLALIPLVLSLAGAAHAAEKPLVSPVKAREDLDVYFPNTEDLAPDEMRVIACGTGMPTSSGTCTPTTSGHWARFSSAAR
jgi:ribonuclease Z